MAATELAAELSVPPSGRGTCDKGYERLPGGGSSRVSLTRYGYTSGSSSAQVHYRIGADLIMVPEEPKPPVAPIPVSQRPRFHEM